ncbi:site-specific DNA-methyltransferase [Thermophilibacter sp.]
MERVDHATPNILDENVEKLAELFPEVVTEVREPDGSLRHTIDVEALKARVGDVAEDQRERYQFTWPGKRDAKQEAYRPIDKCLRPCPEESVDWDSTQNLYIEGDNLDALKLLRNTYAGKIKMIYIDPPYNTGHDFIYDDDFAQTKADYDAESGDYDDEGGRLVANPESNGRFHSDWCSMMYPRLLLARDLLSEDGTLLISIDERELCNLQAVCDEVFSMRGRVATFAWTKTSTPPSLSYKNRKTIEYVLAYERVPSSDKYYGSQLDNGDAPLLNSGNPLKTLLFPPGVIEFPWMKKGTIPASNDGKVSFTTPISVDSHLNRNAINLTGSFKWTQQTLDEEISHGTTFIVKSSQFSIRFQRAADESSYKAPNNNLELNMKTGVGTNESAVSELERLGMKELFDYPKPMSLVKQLVNMRVATDKDALVLDFFSGSATTAHAVMKLNSEDGGNRKFIMVQLPEVCDEKSEAFKAGYNNICEIGKERIRRAGKKIVEEIEEQNKQLKLGEEPKRVPDIGFRVFKIDSSNFEDVSAEPGQITQQALVGLADNLKSGRTAEDILFQVMPQFQIPLSAAIEKRDIDGATVFVVDEGRLVACFDQRVPTEVVVAMAKIQPDYAVMRDASFAGDDAVSNFGELFKTYSPASICRVL